MVTKKIIAWIMVVIWMAVIFSFSAQVAHKSNELSTGFTENLIKIVQKFIPQADFKVQKLNSLMRKNAHFFVYLILGFFISIALRTVGVYGIKTFFIASAICVLYAIIDETHQMFVPGRGPGVKDVFIDGAGASVGIILFLTMYYLIKR